MSYQVAIASSDGKNIDLAFGEASEFFIYMVTDDGGAVFLEKRRWDPALDEAEGCNVNISGCGCRGGKMGKARLISDCRYLLCAKIGPGAKRQLESSNIGIFDLEISVEEALKKIEKINW